MGSAPRWGLCEDLGGITPTSATLLNRRFSLAICQWRTGNRTNYMNALTKFRNFATNLGCNRWVVAVLIATWVFAAPRVEAQTKKPEAETKTSAQTKTVKVD